MQQLPVEQYAVISFTLHVEKWKGRLTNIERGSSMRLIAADALMLRRGENKI